MMNLRNEVDLNQLFIDYVKLVVVWTPILVGVVHQMAMALFGFDAIPVFLDPPGEIRPWASLEFEWWVVLTGATFLLYMLISTRVLSTLPRRVALPFYIYLVFLLIIVKPV
jgi:hypothetical protein